MGKKQRTGGFGLSNRRMQLPFLEMGKAIGRAGFVGEDQELSFGNIMFEMLKHAPIFTEIEGKKNYPVHKRPKT